MPATIFFSGGATVTVAPDAKEVRQQLTRDKDEREPFTKFEAQGTGDVFIAADKVAYVQQIGSPA